MHTTRMDYHILKQAWLISAYLFCNCKKLHVHSKVNVFHPHISKRFLHLSQCCEDGIWMRRWVINEKAKHVDGNWFEGTLGPRKLIIKAIPLYCFTSIAQTVLPKCISLLSCCQAHLLSTYISICNSHLHLVCEHCWSLHLLWTSIMD